MKSGSLTNVYAKTISNDYSCEWPPGPGLSFQSNCIVGFSIVLLYTTSTTTSCLYLGYIIRSTLRDDS